MKKCTIEGFTFTAFINKIKKKSVIISDHQQRWWYEKGPLKGSGPYIMCDLIESVVADL